MGKVYKTSDKGVDKWICVRPGNMLYYSQNFEQTGLIPLKERTFTI